MGCFLCKMPFRSDEINSSITKGSTTPNRNRSRFSDNDTVIALSRRIVLDSISLKDTSPKISIINYVDTNRYQEICLTKVDARHVRFVLKESDETSRFQQSLMLLVNQNAHEVNPRFVVPQEGLDVLVAHITKGNGDNIIQDFKGKMYVAGVESHHCEKNFKGLILHAVRITMLVDFVLQT